MIRDGLLNSEKCRGGGMGFETQITEYNLANSTCTCSACIKSLGIYIAQNKYYIINKSN